MEDDLKAAAARPLSFLQTMRAVAWSFFGVRRGAEYEKDVARLNPVHVIIGGVIGAALFVLVLVLLVQWVIGSGVASATN
ncbi:DUF2970 domain-containing protein [Roseateles koreensis]|uniref:DUF2970 domain-containing protein n=1 Tax=Roseateles koreensis TaxID=2987526 RepID=A0ABT5KML6_9BURK|nr:DUF2970 domain-containing protein [Roseateles koreensis]MDC8784158.1 DUF2970 domain-containing protein [Roseateles koreensis]